MGEFSCPLCNIEFGDAGAVASHMWSDHGVRSSTLAPTKGERGPTLLPLYFASVFFGLITLFVATVVYLAEYFAPVNDELVSHRASLVLLVIGSVLVGLPFVSLLVRGLSSVRHRYFRRE